ncbi:hypothetical protein K4L44_11185 [Halosquirtibacter laminarini]|uniref:Uncharacterized protein n=1 Tax=Halosquirtibacter laminarini TaxID=3374600 RepID=A0AC61NCA0_9BACT|nr:hypothetical protein K4L44_11185 [Prolixibacteraceae bacterium]
MSFLFGLKYKLGMIPKSEKITTEWSNLLEKKYSLDSLANHELVQEYLKLKNQFGDLTKQRENKECKDLQKEIEKLEKKSKIKKFLTLNTVNIDNQPFEVVHYMELKATLTHLLKKDNEEDSEELTTYRRLSENDLVLKYESLSVDESLNFFNSHNLFIDETFASQKHLQDKWSLSPDFSEVSGGSYSQLDDFQAYDESAVVSDGSNCIISLLSKTVEGKVWSSSMGFIPRKFPFVSGFMLSKSSIKSATWSFEVAARFQPQRDLVNTMLLRDKVGGQIIDIFRTGNKTVGFGMNDSNSPASLSSIDFTKTHVYKVEIESKSIVWYLNNIEVARTSGNFGKSEWEIAALVSAKSESVKPSQMKIEWIRAFETI